MSRQLSTVGGLAAILLWSTTFALARSLSEQVGPITAGAAVYLIGGILCLARLALSGKGIAQVLKLPRRYLLGCGFLFVFYSAAIYLAVGLSRDRKQLLEIALLNYLWPALTIILSLPLLKKRASLWLLPGTALALAGVFLVMTQDAAVSWAAWREHLQASPAAYALAIAAAVSWGLYSNLARRWAAPESNGAVELFVPATGLVLLALRFVVDESSPLESPGARRSIGPGGHYRPGLRLVGSGDAQGQPLAGGGLLLPHASVLNIRELPLPQSAARSKTMDRMPAAGGWLVYFLAGRRGAHGCQVACSPQGELSLRFRLPRPGLIEYLVSNKNSTP